MGNVVFNFSFASLFAGCGGERKDKDPPAKDQCPDDLNFLKTLNSIDNVETKIEMLLQKITNGKHTLSILWKAAADNNHTLYKFFGNLELTETRHYRLCSIPLYFGNQAQYHLTIMDETDQQVEYGKQYIEMLKLCLK